MEEKMIFGLCEECYQCRLKKYIYSVDLPEKEKEEFVKKQLAKVESAPADMTANEFRELLLEEYDKVNVPKDFRKINNRFNNLVLDLSVGLEKKISESSDPLLLSLKYALIGNYIDFDVFLDVDENKLVELLNGAEERTIDMKAYAKLNEDFAKAKSLVYLTDNCGEVVLDKLFIKQIKKKYPQIKITAMVRGGGYTLNDATLIDAEESGLTKECDVIGNGLEGTKTVLENMPEDRKELIRNADILISKGQANAESLNGCGLNMYYIFLCKCDRFARNYNAVKFDGILCRDKNAK